MNDFLQLGIAQPLAASLARREITAPTEIQSLTVPPGLTGKDICGKAPTGSGKTIAFGLILVERLRDHTAGRPSGLVLVPTRELAQQVQQEIHLLDVDRKFFTTSVFGGA
ncbi:MAG: DEAD/DEAH box helicase, partial [Actinobacteria bacterium]|nr:DEAD/DEAH box helicase [Actinomycetota bacterium]